MLCYTLILLIFKKKYAVMSLTLHQVIMASKQTKSFYTSLKTTILFEVRILFSQPKRVSS